MVQATVATESEEQNYEGKNYRDTSNNKKQQQIVHTI